MAETTTTPRPSMTRSQKDRLTSDLRTACMRISRRVRFESPSSVAPHQFSVLIRLEDGPRTPKELAAIEKVSAPSMSRTVNGLVELDLVSRADDPTDGRQVILSLTAAGRATIKDSRRRRDQWFAARLETLTDDERALLVEATALLERVAAE
ncbi:MarR family winged helix-turn-helix transcriptional regulator [Oryzobacter telluris]|uniref:MarR family winged helix-turn-helix transcriptional regulator n=1 Tax=Oryzobacter telluris TaxID=3149179 RepID=UPI00370DAC86